MADVDRGQLILLTGLVIAIGFASLTILLNMAIFTENLGSRGTDTGDVDALEFRDVSIETVRGLIEEENEEHHPSQAAVHRNVSDGIETFDRITSTRGAKSSAIADLSSVRVHNGTVLRQNRSDREFVNNEPSPAINWTLVQDVEGTRGFTVEVTELNSTTDPGEEAFRITLDDGGDQWSLFLYNESSESRLAVKNGSGGGLSEHVCDSAVPTDPPFVVNLTAGSVDGTPCSAIEFGKGVSAPYDIKYTWGNRSKGTYNLTVNSTTDLSDFDRYQEGQPFRIPIIYSVSFDITYRTAHVDYRDRVRVLPGEPIWLIEACLSR